MNLQITISPAETNLECWWVIASVNQDGVNYASTGPATRCYSWAEVSDAVSGLLKTAEEQKLLPIQSEAK
jgi:hypothetical protein